jgi:hypothetical protein
MKALTKVLANFLYAEGMGEISDITDTTFWIEGQRKNRVEVFHTHLGNSVDLSSACLCADFLLLALLDKTGDNVILLRTDKVKGQMVDGSIKLVDLADIIVYRWAVEFLPQKT